MKKLLLLAILTGCAHKAPPVIPPTPAQPHIPQAQCWLRGYPHEPGDPYLRMVTECPADFKNVLPRCEKSDPKEFPKCWTEQ